MELNEAIELIEKSIQCEDNNVCVGLQKIVMNIHIMRHEIL